MSTGALIAINVLLLYTFLGPLVLYGIYVFFDSLHRSGTKDEIRRIDTRENMDPALWSHQDVDDFMNQV